MFLALISAVPLAMAEEKKTKQNKTEIDLRVPVYIK